MLVTAGFPWLGAAGADAYVIGGKPWPGGVIRYYNADPGMKTEVAAATKAWNTSGARVHFVAVPRSRAQVVIVGWPKHAFKGSEAGFGTLGAVPPGGMAFDPWGHLVRGSHVWLQPVNVASGLNAGVMTMVATHELGHVLGLNHSTRCATMDASLTDLCTSPPHLWQFICRPLQPDDVAGAIHLYGGRARKLGPQRYCSYVPVPGPATGLTASVLGLGGYGTAHSVRLSWQVPKGVPFDISPTKRSIGYDEVFGASGHCTTATGNELTVFQAKPGAINHTTVQPESPGRWCFTVQILDIYQRPSKSVSIWVTVPGPPPSASFDDACSADGYCSLTNSNPFDVSFNDDSFSSSGSIVAWSWNFGDPGSGSSNTDTSQYPSHNYSAPGTYTVTLTVTDDHGQRATTSQPVYIDP